MRDALVILWAEVDGKGVSQHLRLQIFIDRCVVTREEFHLKSMSFLKMIKVTGTCKGNWVARGQLKPAIGKDHQRTQNLHLMYKPDTTESRFTSENTLQSWPLLGVLEMEHWARQLGAAPRNLGLTQAPDSKTIQTPN